jgi:hypothetical protein
LLVLQTFEVLRSRFFKESTAVPVVPPALRGKLPKANRWMFDARTAAGLTPVRQEDRFEHPFGLKTYQPQ